MVQWKRMRLVSMKMRVRSLASLSGSGSGIAGSCGSCSSDLTPSLETSTCRRYGPKKKKKEEKKKAPKKNTQTWVTISSNSPSTIEHQIPQTTKTTPIVAMSDNLYYFGIIIRT